ncbi:unnamed protein product [Camellia sinensis]
MAPAKKMRRIPLPKRALIEPYSSPTDTPTPALEGVAADGSQTIAPSPSESNALSRSKTVAPSPFETNARADPYMQYRWTVADPATKGAVVQAVRNHDKFEIGENYEENSLSHQVVERKCYVLHKDCKRCYDTGKLNRSKLPYNHSSGSRSFPAAMSIEVKENGGFLPDICDFYKDTHQHKKTKEWIDPICVSQLQEQMTMVRDESIESGTLMTQENISRVVLGKKKGYLRGFGVGPKPSSCDSGLNAASQAREEHLKRLTSELEILHAEQQSDHEEHQKKEEDQQIKDAENARQRQEMQGQIFGIEGMVAQVLEMLNPSKSPP